MSEKSAPTTETETAPEEHAEGELTTTSLETELVVRSREKREIEARIVPYNEVVYTRDIGPEMFLPGAFAHIDPKRVVLQLEHMEPAAGRGLSFEDRDDGPYMVFRASRTPRGDEILELAQDGVTSGVSVTYDPSRSEFEMRNVNGKRVTAVKKADLRAVSTTWKPVYERAVVTAVRSQPDMEEGPVTDTDATATVAAEAPAPAPIVTQMVDNQPIVDAITGLSEQMRSQSDGFAERLAALEERARADFQMPAPAKPAHASKAELFDTVKAGNPVPFRMRTIEDVTIADQDATLPAFVGDMSDVLQTARPFMETTREIPVPDEGTAVQLPKITQHTEVGVQETEKTEVASRKLTTDLDTYNMITAAGAVDVSLQFLKRAPASIRALLFDDMAAQYAAVAESEALDALLGALTINDGGALDPEALALGEAFVNAYAVNQGRLPADTIWLSTAAVGAFIDANNDQTNQPLYGSIQASATVPGGITGSLRGLRPVHVPGMTGKGVDAIVGPSRGFVWAEDGTYRLESDNPALAGRDIGIVGFLFLMPRYAAAFTTYAIAS